MNFIIENGNGNIVVFDYDIVEVIDSDGIYLFFYIGYLIGLGFVFCGICIDVLL